MEKGDSIKIKLYNREMNVKIITLFESGNMFAELLDDEIVFESKKKISKGEIIAVDKKEVIKSNNL